MEFYKFMLLHNFITLFSDHVGILLHDNVFYSLNNLLIIKVYISVKKLIK